MAKREHRLIVEIPNGKIDSSTAEAFGTSLDTALEGIHSKRRFELVVDLGNVSFLSSVGVRELVRVQKAAEKRGGKIILDMVAENISDKLRLTGFDKMLPQKTA